MLQMHAADLQFYSQFVLQHFLYMHNLHWLNGWYAVVACWLLRLCRFWVNLYKTLTDFLLGEPQSWYDLFVQHFWVELPVSCDDSVAYTVFNLSCNFQ